MHLMHMLGLMAERFPEQMASKENDCLRLFLSALKTQVGLA